MKIEGENRCTESTKVSVIIGQKHRENNPFGRIPGIIRMFIGSISLTIPYRVCSATL
jgi:hypothetical protein